MASKFPHQPQMKPIHFFKIITAPSLHEGKLMIPSKFVEKYGAGLPNVLFLKPPNGTEWKINLEKRNGKIWFQKGWKEFAEHHSLAHGHLLVFRCEGTSHFLVRVFDTSALEIDYPLRKEEGRIACNDQGKNAPNDENLQYHRPSQKKKDNSCKMRSSKCAKVENTLILPQAALHHNDTKCKEKATVANQVTALDRASSFQPCNPFFMVVMRPSYVHSCGSPLSLPSKFCKRHFDLHKKSEDISLEMVNGRVWPARCLMRKFNTVTKFRLSGGWKTFSKHNNLKVGDVCTFVLIPKSKLTFQVHIFGNTNKSNCSTSQEKKATAVERASSFEPCNPFFKVVMHPSYLGSHPSSALSLPSEFCKRHFDLHKEEGDINLQVLNGRVWPVRYLITKINTTTKFRITSGWRTFAKHNNLKIGDVCTFELILRSKLTFEVHIFRETDNSNCSASQEKKATAVERSSSFEPCNPFFKVVMHPSYLGSHPSSALSLPSEFCKRHFDLHKKEGDINLQVLNGRVWPVRYLITKINTTTKFRITSGWRTFAKHNNLKIGDVCTFELILRSKLTFEVHIFRETDNSNCSASQGRIDV